MWKPSQAKPCRHWMNDDTECTMTQTNPVLLECTMTRTYPCHFGKYDDTDKTCQHRMYDGTDIPLLSQNVGWHGHTKVFIGDTVSRDLKLLYFSFVIAQFSIVEFFNLRPITGHTVTFKKNKHFKIFSRM